MFDCYLLQIIRVGSVSAASRSAAGDNFIIDVKKCYIMSKDETRIPENEYLSQKTRIQVSKKTRKELKSQGNKGETYDDIINRLLESTDNKTAEEADNQ